MSGQSNFSRSLIAVVAALMMSTVAVAAAVGPAQASVYPVSSSIQKNLNA